LRGSRDPSLTARGVQTLPLPFPDLYDNLFGFSFLGGTPRLEACEYIRRCLCEGAAATLAGACRSI